MRPEPQIVGMRVRRAPAPRKEWEHFIRCDDCGYLLDMRRLDRVLAHEAECPRPGLRSHNGESDQAR